ncbi:hypothetical protein KO465_07285 [Candidatus Micrarchaeota archaeon]|jgi:hypothetical protein|nr:hypothetical protein [Candidatus Micrarchaeota archaeon]
MTEMELQQQNIKHLLELVQQYPNLRIVPMVETECVAGDCCAWWIASWGEAAIEEIYLKDERVYIKDQDHDSLVDEEYDKFFGTDTDDETAMKLAQEKVNAYDWEKVIAVKIEP